MRQYYSLKALRRGEHVLVDGKHYAMDGDGKVVKVGHLYIAERNTGPQVLIAQKIVPFPTEQNQLKHGGWIEAKNKISVAGNPMYTYSYDLHECIRVQEVD